MSSIDRPSVHWRGGSAFGSTPRNRKENKSKATHSNVGKSILRTITSPKHDLLVNLQPNHSYGEHAPSPKTVEPVKERVHQQLRKLETKPFVHFIPRLQFRSFPRRERYVISRTSLVKNSTSIQLVWNTIRAHFGFQVTGAHFLDFACSHLEADERPEDLFQRLMAFVEDTLLRANRLSHLGEVTTEDEELTPTLENVIIFTWLKLIHPSYLS